MKRPVETNTPAIASYTAPIYRYDRLGWDVRSIVTVVHVPTLAGDHRRAVYPGARWHTLVHK
jgi:hypothetical protein